MEALDLYVSAGVSCEISLRVKYARGLIRPGMAVLSVYVFRRGTVDDARRHLLSLPPLSYLDAPVCV